MSAPLISVVSHEQHGVVAVLAASQNLLHLPTTGVQQHRVVGI